MEKEIRIVSARRVLAHRIEWGSAVYPLSVAEASADAEGRWHVAVEPFSRETPGTVFHSGIIAVIAPDGAPFADGSSFPPIFVIA